MILTALAALFAIALLAGLAMLIDCAMRGRNAYRALTCERQRRQRDIGHVTVTQFVPSARAAANSDAMAAQWRAAA